MLSALGLVLSVVGASTQAQELPPILHLDDDFAYMIVDYGVGAVEQCERRTSTADEVFWIRIQLTNVSPNRLKSPTYLSGAEIADSLGNRYTRTSLCAASKQDRYRPSESAAEVVTIASNELVADVQEIRLTFGTRPDSPPGFAIRDPLKRRHNMAGALTYDQWAALGATIRLVNAPNEIPNRALPPAPARIYRPEDDGVTAPRVLTQVRAGYTADAMRAKIEGVVSVEVLVRVDGTVGDVRVVQSLDSVLGLDEQALKAAKRWRFAPGTKDGQPVPVLITIDLPFVIR